MKKCIAKTIIGKEYLHSKKNAFFVSERSAGKICNILNAAKWNLQDGETWYVYDYDWTMESYIFRNLTIYRDTVRVKAV